MSYLSWVAAALVATLPFTLTSNLHAATACSQLKNMQPVIASAKATADNVRKQGCAGDCEMVRKDSNAMDADSLTPTMHLPVVSSPDEVAAWHAEIFERLSDSQQQGASTRYCQLAL